MVIILLIWFSLFFLGMKYNEHIESTAFTQRNTMALRGICSLEIMLGHIGIATESIILFPNRKAGILFVGVFFALSGYGLIYNTKNKEDYLQTFLKRRFSKVLMPAYFVFLIGIVIKSAIAGDAGNLINVINLKFFWEQTNWYVWELLGMYIIFYICAKIDRSLLKSQYIFYAVSIAFICIAFYLKFPTPWYGSSLCCGLGIFYFIKEEAFKKFFRKHILLKTIVCSILLIFACFLFFMYKGLIGDLIARNCASVIFVVLTIVWLQKFCIGNAVSFWCGKYSYEIFLFHLLWINVLREWIVNNVLYTITVIGMTLFSSFIYRNFADFINKLLKDAVKK